MNEYQALVAQNAVLHRDEIKADLLQARAVRERARANLDEADNRVKGLEYLLWSAAQLDGGEPAQKEGMTLHEAMKLVLDDDLIGMMRPVQLAAAINERGLYRMQDGRPVEGQQVSARVGRYPHLFEKEGTFIKPK